MRCCYVLESKRAASQKLSVSSSFAPCGGTFPMWGRLGQCKPGPQGEGFEAAMRRRMSSQTPEKFCAMSKLEYRATSNPRLRK